MILHVSEGFFKLILYKLIKVIRGFFHDKVSHFSMKIKSENSLPALLLTRDSPKGAQLTVCFAEMSGELYTSVTWMWILESESAAKRRGRGFNDKN